MTSTSHCVITGSSSGIGLTLARRLLDASWKITGIDRSPPPAETSGKIESLTVDVTDLAAIARLPLPQERGSVTAFAHCAGIMRGDLDSDIRANGGLCLWLTHVAAPEALVRRLIPALTDKRGRIVLMSSRASQGRAQRGLYAASKAGAEALARSFAAELIGRGITANAIAPGSTDTPMLHDPKRANLKIVNPPIGRLLAADEVASLVQYLIGADAGGITGQTYFICGGSSLPGIPNPT